MPKKTKLKAKYKIRRAILWLFLLVIVGGGGWFIGQRSASAQPEAIPSAINASSTAPTDYVQPDTSSQNSSRSAEDDSESSNEYPEHGSSSRQDADPKEPQIELTSWSLLLVSKDNPLPSGFKVELETVYESYKLDARIIGDALDMINQAKLDGILIFPQSAYYADGEKPVDGNVCSGTNEHATGLCMDLTAPGNDKLDQDFAGTLAYKWLMDNAHTYGFVLRYPESKQQLTGVEYKPWHFRYVGVQHAEAMKTNGYCLEEYLYVLDQGKNTIEEVSQERAAEEEPAN